MVYHTVFLQLAHTDQPTKTMEPAFRVLRAVRNEASADRLERILNERLKGDGGPVIRCRCGEEILLHKGDEQTAEAKAEKTRAIVDEAKSMGRKRDESYKINRDLKLENKQEEAQSRYDTYIDEWNEYPWVKLMKRTKGIKETTRLKPGTGSMQDPEVEVPDLDLEAVNDMPIPPGVLSSEQQFVLLTIAYDNKSERMEPVITLYDLATTEEEAKALCSKHEQAAKPMAIKGVKAGKWVFPYQMAWNDDPQKIIYKDKFLTRYQQQRKDDRVKYKERVAEVKQRAKIDESQAKEMAEQLGLHTDDINVIADTREGAAALAAALSISDKCCREDAVDMMREKYLGQVVEDKIDPW
jgi:hypothetical protein